MKTKLLLLIGIAVLILLIVAAVLTVSYFSKPERVILGKWQDKAFPVTIEFFRDGSMTCSSPEVNPITRKSCNGAGKYKILDARHIELTWPDGTRRPSPELADMDISKKDELILFDSESHVGFFVLRRVK